MNKSFNLILIILISLFPSSFQQTQSCHDQENLLVDFTCAVARDELKNYPEMTTIAVIELENNFTLNFISEILRCLPNNVSKIISTQQNNLSVSLTKSSLIIYVADVIEKVKISLN